MKLLPKILLALYAGLLVNSLLMFVWGDAGISRMRTLHTHRDKLMENLEDLKRINAELSFERDSLMYDETEIELRARTFGYRRDGEIPVILPIREAGASRTLGALIRQIDIPHRNEAILRVLAVCVSVSVFAGFCLWRKYGHSNRGF